MDKKTGTELRDLDALDLDERSKVMQQVEIALQRVRAMAANRKPRSRPGRALRASLLKGAKAAAVTRSAHRNGKKA